MNTLEFDNFLEQIFLIFGRNMPSSKRMKFLFEELKHIPNQANPFILNKFKTELTTMPTNVIKQVQDFYHEWAKNQPAQSKAHCACENGFIWCWVWISRRAVRFLSKCPACASGEPVKSLEARGVFVMPNDYKGGVLQFERDFYLGNVEPSIFAAAKKNEFLSKAKQMSLVGVNGQEIEEQANKELVL